VPDEYLIRASDRRVEAWSTRRLQFEPKGWQVEFRAELRRALTALSAETGFVSALYASAVRDRSDVENVLFYNVGSGFKTTTRRGVRFERSFHHPPPSPQPLTAEALHYHHYEPSSPGGEFTQWREQQVLAQFRQVPLRRLTPETKPGELWLALAEAAAEVAMPAANPEAISVCIRLRVPPQTSSATAIIKPLLDGLVSALHAHDGSSIDEISRRLASQLGIPPQRVAELLSDDRQAVLGVRSLIHLFGAGVQWNPADDLCVACEVVLDRGSTAISLDATVAAVSA
jgi:hypothetical protein